MDRQTLLNYNKKDQFLDIIKKYRQVLLSQVEENLTDKAKFTPGQIFYLKNNYKDDYKDKIEVEGNLSHSISLVNLHNLSQNISESEVIDSEMLEEKPILE